MCLQGASYCGEEWASWMYLKAVPRCRECTLEDARLAVLRCTEGGIGRSNHYLPAHPLHSEGQMTHSNRFPWGRNLGMAYMDNFLDSINQLAKALKADRGKVWKTVGAWNPKKSLVFDHFYIVDFHSAVTFLDRDLRSEGWVKINLQSKDSQNRNGKKTP